MAQYTFSFIRSEYERIPIQMKQRLDKILAESEADPEVKKLMADICLCVEDAVSELSKYAQDQLKIW